MTLLGRLVSVFPLVHALLIFYAVLCFVYHPDWALLLWLLGVTYLMPPMLWRLYSMKYPMRSERVILSGTTRCHWWVAHQLQMVYAAVPFLEAFLRLIPGVYSAWLRLWGSRIGKNVYWTVQVELLDRHLLRIGDGVIFGHRSQCSSHIIARRPNGNLILVARAVCIGNGVFVGACARIGPGVKIPAGVVIPYNAEYRFSYVESVDRTVC